MFVCVFFFLFFFAQIVWHARTFCEDAAQRINKQKLHRKLPLHAMNKFNFWHHCLLWEGSIGGYPIPQYRKKNWQIPCRKVWILRKILRKTSLTINTFSLAITLNEYCKCDTAYVNHRGESVSFLRMLQISRSAETNKQKNAGKRGWKVNNNSYRSKYIFK